MHFAGLSRGLRITGHCEALKTLLGHMVDGAPVLLCFLKFKSPTSWTQEGNGAPLFQWKGDVGQKLGRCLKGSEMEAPGRVAGPHTPPSAWRALEVLREECRVQRGDG